MSKLPLLIVNKCTIIIIITSKVSWKDISAGFPETVFENKIPLIKKTVLYTTTLMHCKARQVLRVLFSTNQGNGSDMTFVAAATKINLKNLKT